MTPDCMTLVVRSLERWTIRIGKILGAEVVPNQEQTDLDRLMDLERILKDLTARMLEKDLGEDV